MAIILPFNGKRPRIAASAFIAPTAVIVGDVEIGEQASVWFGAVIRADIEPVRIGARSNVQDNCVIHTDAGAPAIIGADVSLGHSVVFHGATAHDGSLIGMGATLLNRSEVGAGSILAAGALLPEGKSIPASQLALGSPARVARPVNDAERERLAEGIQHYMTFAEEYRAAIESRES